MKTILVLLAVIAWARPPQTQTGTPAAVPQAPVVAVSTKLTDAQKVLAVARGEMGVREATGNNDGPRVEAYLASTGNVKGEPYCASFVYWCGKTALGDRNPYPRSAWSPDMVAGGTKDVESARPGATGSIYSSEKGRVAHTFLIRKVEGNFTLTNEGNTKIDAVSGSAEDRDAAKGGGCVAKRRPNMTVYKIKNYFP